MSDTDFSRLASRYARARPGYPPELFRRLAALVHPRRVAWDCATGNGQAALGLAEHFDRVIATDVSAAQIRHAAPHPRVEYRTAPAERSGIEDGSVDLVTVATAVHWFDLERFYAEVRRVVRPGGLLAVWTYHVAHVRPPFDGVFGRFYRDTVSPYFAPGARWVDERYETLPLPGTPVDAGAFEVCVTWGLADVVAFVRSWSGTQRYINERGEEALSTFVEELGALWGGPRRARRLRWPLYLRMARM